jgi:hypothetical protein
MQNGPQKKKGGWVQEEATAGMKTEGKLKTLIWK